jgi:hypothetical protein
MSGSLIFPDLSPESSDALKFSFSFTATFFLLYGSVRRNLPPAGSFSLRGKTLSSENGWRDRRKTRTPLFSKLLKTENKARPAWPRRAARFNLIVRRS